MLKIGILLGDDIGLEVVPECVKVMKAAAAGAGLEVAWSEHPIGRRGHELHGHTFPQLTIDALDKLDGWILGPIGHNAYPRNDPTWIMPPVRKRFELFASVKPVKSYPNIKSVHKDVDLFFLRETTEGFKVDTNMFAGHGEFQPSEDMALAVRVTTRRKCNLIARAAFEVAQTRPRRKVSAIHKNTVFKMGDGIFADECRKVAKEFPGVELEEVIVDTFAMKLVMNPQQYDVVVTTNIYGDILTDEAAGLIGGLGLAPGLNASDRHAMAQATHGSAPDIAGKNIANPYAIIMSGKMLFEWLGMKRSDARAREAAKLIENAMERIIAEARYLTPDLGGSARCSEMGDAVARAIR